jgi:hypothetical protein
MRYLIAAALVAGATGAMAQSEPTRFPPYIQMTVGLVQIYGTDQPITDVVVGKAEVADVTLLTDQRVAITAKDGGLTTIILLDKDKRVVSTAEVEVASKARMGRHEVVVRSFGRNGMYTTNIHLCRDEDGGCVFERTVENKEPVPIISTGPVYTSGPVNSR